MDLNEIMAQARDLQEKVKTVQKELDKIVVKGLADNGAVIVDMTCKYNVKNVTISPEAMNNTAKKLSQIVMDAFIDAKNKADAVIDDRMADVTDGIGLPL